MSEEIIVNGNYNADPAKIELLKKDKIGVYIEAGQKAMEDEKYSEYAARIAEIDSQIAAIGAAIKAEEEAKAERERAARQEAEERAKADQESVAKRTCPKCHTVNIVGMNFCSQCGTKLGVPVEAQPAKRFCSNCGAIIVSGNAFCGSCGKKV